MNQLPSLLCRCSSCKKQKPGIHAKRINAFVSLVDVSNESHFSILSVSLGTGIPKQLGRIWQVYYNNIYQVKKTLSVGYVT